MIKYSLIENVLTPDPNDYYAQIQITGRAGGEDLVDRMLSMGSTVTKADLLAVMNLLDEAALALLKEGYRVDLAGIVDLYPRLQGVFVGPGDGYDASRHSLSVTATASQGFIARVRADASVQKEETVTPMPVPLQFLDAASGDANGALTPSNIGTLAGSRLKFDPGKADEGVYFIASGGGETKVTVVSINKPGQLVFLTPALASGDYSLQVRARVNKSAEVRVGTLDATLTVP
ncbi:DNA-binding domain-containing protein [Haloferula sargassicola]|uniref:DUF4469 domain-containing protein n=1 Tax=Haloferula sargassicola TaxID=490096 RepID=A0ABP9UPP1_9BACT